MPTDTPLPESGAVTPFFRSSTWLAGHRRAWIGGLIALAFAGYWLTGIFTVAADEQAAIRRFGRLAARLGPGIHYRLPWPIDRVNVVKTTSVVKTGVGFDLGEGDARAAGMEILTGDTNIIRVAMALQYVIRNPAAFLFDIEDPSALVGSIAASVLTETVLGMPVDEVLTTGRLAIQERVKTGTQAILDRYESGIQITSANMMGIAFDGSVAQAFQDVANAGADRENKINQGRSYANDLLPKARGEARSMVLAAQSYKEQHVAEAIGNTTRFLELLAEYNKAPDVTRTRLYLEAMEKILPKVKKYVIDSAHGQKPINLRLGPTPP